MPAPPPPPRRRDASHAAALARLAALPRPPPGGWPPVSDRAAAAVLVALFEGPAGESRVLLTRRALTLRAHPGEVALPGGRCDPGETGTQAALREAWEEVGLARDSVTIVATLPPFLSKHHNSVEVVIASVPSSSGGAPPPGLTPAAGEVASIFHERLDRFLSDARHTSRAATWGPAGPPFMLHWFECGGCDAPVWGLTAGVLIEVAVAAFGRAPPFDVHPRGAPPYGRIVCFGGRVTVRDDEEGG